MSEADRTWGTLNRDPLMDRPHLFTQLAQFISYTNGSREQIIKTLDGQNLFRNCITCQNFIEHMAVCNLNGQVPPPRIIAYGCECHSDEIPF